MKHFISIVAILAASAAIALAQPTALAASAAIALAQPTADAVKKQEKTVQVVKTTTTTYDTIALSISPTMVAVAYDSLINARFDQIDQQIKNSSTQTRKIVRNEMQGGQVGYVLTKVLQNSIPLMPFILGIFVALFWFRYSYKRRVLRQEMIYKYFDRGEAIPEWLTREEASVANDSTTPSKKNAKLFLVLSFISAVVTLIWTIALASSYNSWSQITTSVLAISAFGFTTVYCFRLFLKRSE